MALTKDQDDALAQLVAAYPAGIGFHADRQEAIALMDSLVPDYATVITEQDDPQLPAGGRSYVLNDSMAAAHARALARADQATFN